MGFGNAAKGLRRIFTLSIGSVGRWWMGKTLLSWMIVFDEALEGGFLLY